MAVDILAMIRDVFPFKDLVTHRVNLDNINDRLRIADVSLGLLVVRLGSRLESGEARGPESAGMQISFFRYASKLSS
jgi:hypothetical protein